MSTKSAEYQNTQPVSVGEKLAEKCSDKITKARVLKDEGNSAFRAGNYKTAIRKYHYALMYTKGVTGQVDMSALPGLEQVSRFVATAEEKSEAKEITLNVSNNLAACFVKTKKWEKALEHASKVLEDQPDNAKALYRRGTAHIHLNRIDEARIDLKRAQEIAPENSDIRRQMISLDKISQELDSEERKMYSTMLGNKKA